MDDVTGLKPKGRRETQYRQAIAAPAGHEAMAKAENKLFRDEMAYRANIVLRATASPHGFREIQTVATSRNKICDSPNINVVE
ncbi:hypothetical protein CLAIMM_07622 [Cladophialophora immunda]|nr:hypothetical protein CLAIMM_07622 [Cladophialophora immunda]